MNKSLPAGVGPGPGYPGELGRHVTPRPESRPRESGSGRLRQEAASGPPRTPESPKLEPHPPQPTMISSRHHPAAGMRGDIKFKPLAVTADPLLALTQQVAVPLMIMASGPLGPFAAWRLGRQIPNIGCRLPRCRRTNSGPESCTRYYGPIVYDRFGAVDGDFCCVKRYKFQ